MKKVRLNKIVQGKKPISVGDFGHIFFRVALAVVIIGIVTGIKTAAAQETRWIFESTHSIAQLKPQILGSPHIVTDTVGTAISFDGVDDGLVVSRIPVTGWKQFTIEVLFRPDKDGPTEPRFIHFEDQELNRGTFEVRLTRKGEFYMDTFLKNGKSGKGLTLIDSTILHPAGKWYWTSVVYDGKTMSSYVNGKKELQGEIAFPPMTAGNISFGVRLNKVGWFKGAIREVRFHPTVLTPGQMQRR